MVAFNKRYLLHHLFYFMVVLENERRSITSSNYVERSVGKSSNVKRNHGSPITQSVPVFILCGRCHWCPTYLDTNRILQEYKVDDDNNKICPRCDTIDSLSSLQYCPMNLSHLITQSKEE
jgi:hypothetical protein